jgi:hypothetical protein
MIIPQAWRRRTRGTRTYVGTVSVWRPPAQEGAVALALIASTFLPAPPANASPAQPFLRKAFVTISAVRFLGERVEDALGLLASALMDWTSFFCSTIFGALVGFAVCYVQSRIDALRRAQERLHDDRRKVYSDVLEPFIRLFSGVKNPTEMHKALEQMLSFEHRRPPSSSPSSDQIALISLPR